MHQKLFRPLLLGSLFAVSMLAVSCDSITQDQLMTMRELHKQEMQLKDAISKKKSEIKKLETEVAARKKESDKCNEDRAFVKEKLKTWPNVWPDYTPEKK